ncbi:MAG TPA: MoaD/ThiS family protein [Cyclobacteriaceae bacterium]|nr:MoaD/ThiS family protein [Cyclobacteriaceae bacterium]
MKVNLLAFGIAREILKTKTLEFDVQSGDTIAVLKEKLLKQHPELGKLKSLSFAVGENYQPDTFKLSDKDEVAIIPPVSGG